MFSICNTQTVTVNSINDVEEKTLLYIIYYIIIFNIFIYRSKMNIVMRKMSIYQFGKCFYFLYF